MIELTGVDFGITPPVGIGDMSLRHGGYMTPHSSHQNGLDVDVRYVRNDGFSTGLNLNKEPDKFDTVATIQLMNYFIQNGNVTLIYVNMTLTGITTSDVSVIQHDAGHYDHFHVRIAKP